MQNASINSETSTPADDITTDKSSDPCPAGIMIGIIGLVTLPCFLSPWRHTYLYLQFENIFVSSRKNTR